MTLAGRVFSNRYEIQHEVAQGGMAEVYLARDELLKRPVALKALFPEYAREPSFVERFRREAQAAANLNHPNIVAIYDWGQESGTYFIVMEYVEGRSLRDLIRSEGPVDPNRAADIAGEMAAALAFAHRNGVVHRDVKPGNVLLTRSGNVKVTDFGIARAGTSDGLTQTGSVMGTATYFSPEQAQGLPVDGRSDVYSLGVVLYEMVTGAPPFSGDSPVAVAYKHVREDPALPSQLNPEVPRPLEQIIMTALAKDPSDRYQTADDLRADLLRFRRGRPVTATAVTAIVTDIPTAATRTQAAGAYAAASTMASPRVDERTRYTPPASYQRQGVNKAMVSILTLLALAAIVGGILYIATKNGSTQGHVDVPDVTNKQVNVATSELRAQHLVPAIKKVPDATHAVNTVVSQDPAAGKSVARNTTVTLIVSTGAGDVQIPPAIVNETVNDATNTLRFAGFDVVVQRQASDSVAFDNVITSNPAPGTRVPKGSRVTLVVSSGRAPIAIPDVSRQSQDFALQTLQQAGFTDIQPLNETSNTVPSGSVTRTDPVAGTKVSPATTIKMYVSTGTATVTVPSETGFPFAQAKSDLESKGFTVGILNTPDNNNVGLVVSQDPKAGTAVAPGAHVTLHVGVATSTTTISTTTTT